MTANTHQEKMALRRASAWALVGIPPLLAIPNQYKTYAAAVYIGVTIILLAPAHIADQDGDQSV